MKTTNPPTPPKPNRVGTPQSFYLPPDVEKALEAYFASQDAPPTKTGIYVTGVKLFLARHGFWPPPQADDAGE